jgi:hypothetical protein
MIETQDPVFANLMEQLRYDLPTEAETRVVNLAAVAIGIFRSRSLQVGQVVARSPWRLAGMPSRNGCNVSLRTLVSKWRSTSSPWSSGSWGGL